MNPEQIENANSQTIARLNDLLRRTSSPHLGRVVLTRSVAESKNRNEVIEAVREFDAFTVNNDPYHEHDFGSVKIGGVKYFFKIDYYDATLTKWSDPLADETVRVLTIMRADEY